MKKSLLYYSSAAISFLISIIWSSVMFLNYELLKRLHLNYSLIGLAFIFPAIWLCKKGNEWYNTEHNTPIQAVIIPRRRWKIVNIVAVSLLALMAILMLVKVFWMEWSSY